MFSGVLGRLSLPDCLPFSKPKVNWLLHPVMVAWKQLFSRDSLHASAVNAICHFRLSLKECETRARARQKQIESRLIRDLFAFFASFERLFFMNYLHNSKNFCTSARPFPAGGFPPKVLQGNAGHLGKVSPRRKYRCAITFCAVAPALMRA